MDVVGEMTVNVRSRIRNFNGTEIPSATRAEFFHCGDPDCKHVHLVGFDEDNHPFCEIVLSRKQLQTAFRIADELEVVRF